MSSEPLPPDSALLNLIRAVSQPGDGVALGVPSPEESMRREREQLENAQRATLNVATDKYLLKTEQMFGTVKTIVWAWIVGLAVILVLQGWDWFKFAIPTSVLVTLAGTATVNVIGLIVVLARHYFPAGGPSWLLPPK